MDPHTLRMTESTIRTLVSTEYTFVSLHGGLNDLAAELVKAAHDVPACADAARKVRKLRSALAGILSGLDTHITAAVEAYEELEPAPF